MDFTTQALQRIDEFERRHGSYVALLHEYVEAAIRPSPDQQIVQKLDRRLRTHNRLCREAVQALRIERHYQARGMR